MLTLLQGIRVVDLTTIVFGPMATQILADLGAEVIKVESLDGDLARSSGAISPAGMGAVYANNNRNKKSVSVNLKTPQGKEVVANLVKKADVFIHNMRSDAVERLGFDAAAVRQIKPDIVYCTAVGYGSAGPYAGRPAYDDVIQAACGLASLPMYTGNDPVYVPSVIADKIAALHVVYGVMAALLNKTRTGKGSTVEVPMFESLVAFVMNEHLDAATYSAEDRPGYNRLLNPNRRPFKTRDGWLAVMPYSKDQWVRLLEKLNKMEVLQQHWFDSAAGRNSHSEFLYGLLVESMPESDTDEWVRILSAIDIPHAKVNTLEDLLADEHLRQTGFFHSTDTLTGRVHSVAQPLNFEGCDVIDDTAPEEVGQSTEQILLSMGYSAEQIKQMRKAGVLRE
ncbi:hypothetical protein AB833_26630 [Chromatiales bacterium (ex Bugula neritina AB1)]|nr:hypothetical protein AB833_26630 [Chromatiales bacterium (ex Bugula neritina AB1)]